LNPASNQLPWEQIQATVITTRLDGCFDCGSKTLPYIKVQGGFASHDSITAVIWSSEPGRVFCGAKVMTNLQTGYSMTREDVKDDSIVQSRHFSLISKAGVSAQVSVASLNPNTLYEFACMAESEEGGESDQENLELTRRRWQTEKEYIPIWSVTTAMTVYEGEPITAAFSIRVRMTEIGYLFCNRYLTTETGETGMKMMPNANLLRKDGYRIKSPDVKLESGGVFNDVVWNLTYQAFCTAEENDYKNESMMDTDGLPPDYPEVRMMKYSMKQDYVRLELLVARGPATTYCQAFRWASRPFSFRPPTPDHESMRSSKYTKDTMTRLSGVFVMYLTNLASGSLHDIYCYAEEWMPAAPPDAIEPPRRGMNLLDISKTRLTIRTEGPKYYELGWKCMAGHICAISDIEGKGLSPLDQVVVQPDTCPSICQCNGKEDNDRKGVKCSYVAQDRNIRPPDPQFGYGTREAVDVEDPRGAWCYVDTDKCFDQVESLVFPGSFVSYAACFYQNAVIGAPGVAPEGFPFDGLVQMTSPSAEAYNFGTEPLYAGGKPYQLCWCNGTENGADGCKSINTFRMRIGILHIVGPTAKQQKKLNDLHSWVAMCLEVLQGAWAGGWQQTRCHA